LALIERNLDGLVLDCGAGSRDVYHHNVVNYEIVAYDSTDVLGIGEALPFLDNSFDAVISIAVLEHVRDPFQCAAEIVRVLKPGGQLLCAVPFLQPMHGYPHHYFNATEQGLRRLFEESLAIESVFVPHVGHPAFALHWILSSWAASLPDAPQAAFLDQRIGDLLQGSPADMAGQSFGDLPQETKHELACGFVLMGRK
jgi:SAM-dependent methyltransferase